MPLRDGEAQRPDPSSMVMDVGDPQVEKQAEYRRRMECWRRARLLSRKTLPGGRSWPFRGWRMAQWSSTLTFWSPNPIQQLGALWP